MSQNAEYVPPTCILTGEDGENEDDCTTHEHEVPNADYGATLRDALGTVKGVPGSGERVDSHPANWLRDFFHANGGRLTVQQFEAGFGRMTFTYGHKLHAAWNKLQREDYVERVGNEWLWPMQIDRSGSGDS